MRPRKRFGQHWLKSEQVLGEIIAAADLNPSDRLLEIGPGTGNLTVELLASGVPLLAVEVDRDLCKKLVRKFGDRDNFLLLEGSVLDLDLETMVAPFPQFQNPNKVVANIPYNITGPILEKLLGTIGNPNPQPFQSITLLIQKEVGDRLWATPKTKAFGALSVKVQYLAHCELICPVPPSAFYPKPKVDSAVVRLTPRPFPHRVEHPAFMETLLKVGFSNKRKMLKNNLKSLFTLAQLQEAFTAVHIPENARAEEVSVETWVALSNVLKLLL